EHHPQQVSMLQVQYRMHAKIMEFPSRYFYDGNLVAHDSVRSALLRPDQAPVLFIDTAACGFQEVQDPETLSRRNGEQAALVIRQVEALIEEIGIDSWIDERITMGIITPYSAQVDELRKLAEASAVMARVYSSITINTVDAFQGQERDVIVISFVRSNDKGE